MERQARRAQVLRHAKRIFARKGYHRTNVADIIARARIARGEPWEHLVPGGIVERVRKIYS